MSKLPTICPPNCPHCREKHEFRLLRSSTRDSSIHLLTRTTTSSSDSLSSSITLDAILCGKTRTPVTFDDLIRWLEWRDDELGLGVVKFLLAGYRYRKDFEALTKEEQDLSPPPFQAISILTLSDPTLTLPVLPNQNSTSQVSQSTSLTLRGGSSKSNASTIAFSERSFALSKPRVALDAAYSRNRDSTISVDSTRGTILTRGLSRAGRGGGGGGHGRIGLPSQGRHLETRSPNLNLNPFTAPEFEVRPPVASRTNAPNPEDKPDQAKQPLRHQLEDIIATHLSRPLITSLIPPVTLSRAKHEATLTTHPEVLEPVLEPLENWFTTQHLDHFLDDSIRNLHKYTARGRALIGALTTIVAAGTTVLLMLSPSPFRPEGPEIERYWRMLLIPIFLGGIGYGLGSRAGLCFWLALAGVREDPFDISKSKFTILWRLTGTAWSVRRVEDPILRRHQRREAYKIASALTVVLAILAAVLWFLPYIILGA